MTKANMVRTCRALVPDTRRSQDRAARRPSVRRSITRVRRFGDGIGMTSTAAGCIRALTHSPDAGLVGLAPVLARDGFPSRGTGSTYNSVGGWAQD